ncbi:helix-turn-helix domain-containing protein [bacterium]|jgi:excisionase family DNA binding protein|nr:helix-turn-helix domain-containing protein [bacterium]
MRLVSVSEAAHFLAVSRATVRNWCLQGKINFIQIGDFIHVDLWSFLESRGINPEPIFASLEERKKNAPKTRRTKKTA